MKRPAGSVRKKGARKGNPRPGTGGTDQTAKIPADTPPSGRLQAYWQKRDFASTPEPPGKGQPPQPPAVAVTTHPTFMVHRHHARRLHYDLRLEMDGALASWAIPRGPSYDPRERRLAVETEDHPLEYGNFEGRIPEGEYGAGDSIIWDRGLFDTIPPGRGPAMRAKGHMDLLLMGEKLKGRWHLVRTGRASPARGNKSAADKDGSAAATAHDLSARSTKAEWLLMKAEDEFADPDFDVVEQRPESVLSGRKVTRGPAPADVEKGITSPIQLLIGVWPPAPIAQPKRKQASTKAQQTFDFQAAPDGQRAIAALASGRVALQTTEGRDLAAGAPAVVRELARAGATQMVTDGILTNEAHPRFLALDLLWLDGVDERARPLAERLELLGSVLPLPQTGAAATFLAATTLHGTIANVKNQVRELGLARLWARSANHYGAPDTFTDLSPSP